MSDIPKRLGDVSEEDLAKLEVVGAFYLQLSHNLMGIFPAIIKKTEEPVVCLKKELLEKVKELLPSRQCRVSEIILKADLENGYGFDASLMFFQDLPPLLIFTEKDFERLTVEEEPFKWAPGLVSDDMSEEEFIDTLENAIK